MEFSPFSHLHFIVIYILNKEYMMFKNNHIWIRVVLPFLLLSSFSYAIEIKNLSVAVDVAGKQRMFTQRMLKDYAMVGLENNFGNPGEDLKKIMGLFDNHLQSLRTFNKDKATEESLAKSKSTLGTYTVGIKFGTK